MSDFSFTRYRPELRDTWDAVVRRSKNGNFLHLRDYMDYHAHRFDEQSVIVANKGKPVAVFPCNRLEQRIVSHSGLTYAGLIYGHDVHAADVLDILTGLAARFREAGATTLVYKATPHIFHRYPAQEDLYALSRLDARLSRRDLSSAILLAERPKLSDSRKNTIRKAMKAQVTVRESADFGAFHQLLTEVLAKFDTLPVHSLADLELLKGRFPQGIRLFCAHHEGRLVAGTIVYDFGAAVHTQYMASSDEGRALGALDLVLFQLIDQDFRDRTWFRFGISTEQDGHELNTGLIFQKEGFGARGIVHDFYDVPLQGGAARTVQ